MDIAVVGIATALTLAGGRIERARVALGAVAPMPVRAGRTEAQLEGETLSDEVLARAADAAVEECSPISDVRGSAEFRRHIVRVTTERMLRLAAEREGAPEANDGNRSNQIALQAGRSLQGHRRPSAATQFPTTH